MSRVLSICVFVTLITKLQPFCQKSGETKYFIPGDNGTYYEALLNCRKKGAVLATYASKEVGRNIKAQMLDMIVVDSFYWVSGESYWEENEVRWHSHTTGQQLPNDIWCPGQPNYPNGRTNEYVEPAQVAHFRKDFDICCNDYPWFGELRYICEVTDQ